MRRAVSSQEKSFARSSPAADETFAFGERALRGGGEVAVLGEHRRVVRDLAERGSAAATTGVPHAMASSTGSPNPSKRDGSTSAAAPR